MREQPIAKMIRYAPINEAMSMVLEVLELMAMAMLAKTNTPIETMNLDGCCMITFWLKQPKV